MKKNKLSEEKKRLDIDLWIILLSTLAFFLFYALMNSRLISYIKDERISAIPRLLVNAVLQFGIAGLGVSIVCILRKENFSYFGLVKKNCVKSIFWTIICFIPTVLYVIFSGQYTGYHPFHILVTDSVIKRGFPISVIGMAIIIVVWGFFEGFNYVVIADKINKRYPSTNQWLDYGAIVCALVCILFHPLTLSFWGIVSIFTTFIAIYGMLVVKKKTENAWGAIFAFCFIWNAL